MPRVGQNPMKWLSDDREPKQITVTTIVHIPALEGYWTHCLDVLKLCLQSLHQNTQHPFDLMVFDNGSCAEVQDYLLQLQREGAIQYLILSEYNLRKIGTLDFLLSVAPGEIISFADSDVYFLPGWLEASLEILKAFPEAGQITALPTADKALEYCSATLKAIKKDPSIAIQEGDNLIPEKFINAHAISLGESPKRYQHRLNGRNDILISREEVNAFVSAQDFQFTTTKKAVQPLLPLKVTQPEEYYDPVYSPVLEARLDRAGYWRLSTTDYLIHHLGNTLPEQDELNWIFEDNQLLSINTTKNSNQKTIAKKNRLLQNRYMRRFLKRVNNYTYTLLYGD